MLLVKWIDGAIIRNNTIYPMLMNILLYGVPTFLAVYFGADFVANIIESIPEKLYLV